MKPPSSGLPASRRGPNSPPGDRSRLVWRLGDFLEQRADEFAEPEAVAKFANDAEYGLQASVWTRNLKAASRN